MACVPSDIWKVPVTASPVCLVHVLTSLLGLSYSSVVFRLPTSLGCSVDWFSSLNFSQAIDLLNALISPGCVLSLPREFFSSVTLIFTPSLPPEVPRVSLCAVLFQERL